MRNNHSGSLRTDIRKYRAQYMMLAPYLILFTVFTIIPVISAIILGLTYYNFFETPRFVFLDNFRRLFIHDDVFLIAVKNTLLFALITGPVSYAACFLLAWLINDFSSKVRAVLTTIFYAPSISGAVYTVWQLIFSSDSYGYLNAIFMRLGFLDMPKMWLGDTRTAMPVVIIVSLWLSLGTSFLAFIAGFQSIDKSLYEAGQVDGVSNRWQELWYIILPTMKPQLMFASVMQITAAFGVGDVTAALAGLPSVDYAAHTIVNHITDYGYIRMELSYASAVATVLFVIMISSNRIVQKLLVKVGT
jgi:multiple sugar transport system permease protein